jgi:streptomycin 6-kinase
MTPTSAGPPTDGRPAADFAADASPQGRAWISEWPALLRVLADRWDLTVTTGEFRAGYHAVVFPASRDGRLLALKLTWPPNRARGEADALDAWRGRGAVELVAADVPRGALLLERLDAVRTLAGLPLAQAAATAGALARTLAIPAPESFPSLRASARRLAATFEARQRALGDPVPAEWVTLAAGLASDLAGDGERCLVHADLHYGNILASLPDGGRWVAIDPKAAAGAPERSVAELLWTRADELADAQAIIGLLDAITQAGRLDRGKAVAWGFVRSVDYWLWGLGHGLTADPVRCERVAGALAALAVREPG